MLITNATLIPWGLPNQILENHALYLADGRITEIGPQAELAAQARELAPAVWERYQKLVPL